MISSDGIEPATLQLLADPSVSPEQWRNPRTIQMLFSFTADALRPTAATNLLNLRVENKPW